MGSRLMELAEEIKDSMPPEATSKLTVVELAEALGEAFAEAARDSEGICEMCQGQGDLCSLCEKAPLVCKCPTPLLFHCGLCQGTGLR